MGSYVLGYLDEIDEIVDKKPKNAPFLPVFRRSGKVYTYDKCLYKDNWILVGKKRDKDGEDKTNYLIRFSWVKSAKHVLVAGTNSVYDKKLSVYWSKRTLQYGGLSLRERTLLKTQKGVCSYCQTPIENGQVEVDHIIPKAKGREGSL